MDHQMGHRLDPSDLKRCQNVCGQYWWCTNLGMFASGGFLSQGDSRDHHGGDPCPGGLEVTGGRPRSSQQDFHYRLREWTKSDQHRHRSENYCHPRRVCPGPGPDPCQRCLTVMALRGHAGCSAVQMALLAANMVARAVSRMQKVGCSKAHHRDLDLTRWGGAPCPEEVKVRCWWTRLASLREEPMGQR